MSTVASFIDFEADESPKWREGKIAPGLTVQEMIQKIMHFQIRWNNEKECCSKRVIDTADHYFLTTFVYHVNTEEGHGCNTKEGVESCINMAFPSQRPLSKQEKETINLIQAYSYLLNVVKEIEDNTEREHLRGLLEINSVKEVHKLILKDIKLKPNSTKPGEFSKCKRYTTFRGEEYEYGSPEGLEQRVLTLLDRYNDLITYSVKGEENLEDRIYKMFKTCSWLLFQLLDEHPFSDGNGRLCRLLCSYALSFMSPFPTPIYNVWSETKKDDYIEALVDARKSIDKHPRSLTTMIIECNYRGWEEFFKRIDKAKGDNNH